MYTGKDNFIFTFTFGFYFSCFNNDNLNIERIILGILLDIRNREYKRDGASVCGSTK